MCKEKKWEWERIEEILASFAHEAVWTAPQKENVISGNMPVSAILGNGAVGITSCDTEPGCKQYLISRGDFWGDAAREWGFRGRTPTLMTVGGLVLRAEEESRFFDAKAEDGIYREALDIGRAEIRTITRLGGLPVRIVSWLSAVCDLMVTTVTSLGKENSILEICPYASTSNSAAAKSCPVQGEADEKSGTVWALRQTAPSGGARFISEAVIAVKPVTGRILSVTAKKDGGVLCMNLPAGDSVTFMTAITGNGGLSETELSEKRALREAEELLRKYAEEKATEELHCTHLRWWQDYYLLSWVDFHDPELNRIYYGLQYIFASTVREGTVAPGLYGVWRTQDTPGWQGDYHLNYNFQATWYGACAGNRVQGFFEPFADAVLGFMDSGLARSADPKQIRRIGQKEGISPTACTEYLRKRLENPEDLGGGIPGGILYPVGIVPYITDKEYCKYEGQTMDAWFCGLIFLEYYEMTGDLAWMEKKRHGYSPYDFLKAVAVFYEKWLEKRAPRRSNHLFSQPEEGDVYTRAVRCMAEYPTYSGTGDYVYVLMDGATEDFRDCNPTAYLGVLKRLMNGLIEISQRLGKDAEKRELWADIREHLVPPEKNVFWVNGRRVLGFSENDYQRNPSGEVTGAEVQLEMIQPGGIWGFDSAPEILELCRNTIAHHNTWTWNNSVPKVYSHGARVGYAPELLMKEIKGAGILGSMKKNYHIYDGVHGVEKVGFLQALHDLLVQEDGGIVKLFPALPSGQAAEFYRIRVKGAFLLSTARDSQGRTERVTVQSLKGGLLELVSPWEGVTAETASGRKIRLERGCTRHTGEITVRLHTKPGEEYLLREEKQEREAEKREQEEEK